MFQSTNPLVRPTASHPCFRFAGFAGAAILGYSLLGCANKQSSSEESKNGSAAKSTETAASKQQAPAENHEPVLTVSATALAKEYKTDAKAADQKYKGKWIAVEGMSLGTEVMKPLAGFSKHEATLILSGGEPPTGDDARIRCECLMTETDKALRVSMRQKLKVIGKCTGSDAPPAILLESARIAEMGADPAVVVTVQTLLADYLKDEKSADAKYKNKIVAVTGAGAELKTESGVPSLVFPGGKGKSGEAVPVTCTFVPDWNYRLTNVKPGSSITIKGHCDGRGSLSDGIVLGSCALMP